MIADRDRYWELLTALECLRDDFQRVAEEQPYLGSQLILPPSQDQALTAAVWNAFVNANQGRMLRSKSEWEDWQVFPDHSACCRFYGAGGRRVVDRLLRMASSAFDVLAQLRIFADGGGFVPEGFRADFSSIGSRWKFCADSAAFDWLQLVHQTGIVYRTTVLHGDFGPWNRPPHPACIEQLAACGGDHEYISAVCDFDDDLEDCIAQSEDGEPSFLLHPPTLTLRNNVWSSSAEAINVWLDSDLMIPVEVLDTPPIWLPTFSTCESEETPDVPTGFSQEVVEADTPVAEQVLHEIDYASLRDVKPHWHPWSEVTGQLSFGDYLIKEFKTAAPAQAQVLAAFQEEGWPERIDDPLPPKGDQVPQRRLRETTDSLNGCHIHKNLIRFHGDGTAQGVRWVFVHRKGGN